MNKLRLLTKILLVTVLLCMSGSVWAAAALTKDLEITGYEAVNLFDFQNKDYDGTSLASFDDLAGLGVSAQATLGAAYGNNNWYDDTANSRGLRLQSGGGRWIQFTVDIKKDDYIIINGGAASEAYEISMTNGTTTSLSAASNYLCFKATQDAASLKLTVHRYNYLLQILVMRVSASATTADYTINYKYNGSVIKSENGNKAIGTLVEAENPITVNDTRYFIKAGETTLMTIADGTNTLNVDMRLAENYSYTVKAVDGSNNDLNASLASGSVVEGDAVNVTYPRWILSGTTLYACGSGAVPYNTSFTPDANNYIKNITYNSGTVNNVVFYTEAEDVAGVSVGTNDKRASKNQMGHTVSADNYKQATTLSPGKYIIYMRGQNGNAAARAYNFKVGDNVEFHGEIANGTNVDANSGEFSVYKNSALSFASEGSSASGIDYFYVVKTGDAVVTPTISDVGWATYCSEYALDFTGVTALTAYTASVDGTTVKFDKVTGKVPANTGLLISGETASVPVCASAEPVANIMEGVTDETEKTAETIYVLKNGTSGLGFYKNANKFTLRANSAYIPAANIPSGTTARGFISLDDSATGIKNLTPTLSEGEGAIYTLDGCKVAIAPLGMGKNVQLKKGVYVVDGKKVIIK